MPPLALLVLAIGLASSGCALAQGCFSAEETRQQVQRHGLVNLSEVANSVRPQMRAEMISARLCEVGGSLVYLLTMLERDGRVRRYTVDARSGHLINDR
jgi:uncharacterized membrane protein YkoI